ncbi:MAG: hypothetical protein K1Y36_16800 [Blastocatellia bacterium]|nr:hypothetical protein [Blastocatellia bacterium]
MSTVSLSARANFQTPPRRLMLDAATELAGGTSSKVPRSALFERNLIEVLQQPAQPLHLVEPPAVAEPQPVAHWEAWLCSSQGSLPSLATILVSRLQAAAEDLLSPAQVRVSGEEIEVDLTLLPIVVDVEVETGVEVPFLPGTQSVSDLMKLRSRLEDERNSFFSRV